jgi:hypothetical protein
LQEASSKWIDLAKKYCREVLDLHDYEKHKNKYDEEVFIIKTGLKFQNSEKADTKWMYSIFYFRLKSKD